MRTWLFSLFRSRVFEHLCSRLSAVSPQGGIFLAPSPVTWRSPQRKKNGDGKHDKITAGWLDGTVNLDGIIKVPLWLTLSLTSLEHEEDGSEWLPSPSWNDQMDEVDFLNYLLFISFYQQKSRKIIPQYITALLVLTIFGSNSAEKWSGPCWFLFVALFFLALLVLEMSQIGAPFPLFWWHTVKIDSQWCNRLMEERTFLNHFLYWVGLAAGLGWHLPRAISPLWAADGTSLSITWWDKFHSVGLISDQWYFFLFLGKSCFN